MQLRPGDKLIDKFEIKSTLGQGGFGCAYLAIDLSLGVQRVIKELLAGHLVDKSTQRRFINEARTMASLNDPHIVTVHLLLQPNEFPSVKNYYIIMEYMAGGSLDHWLRREGKRSEKEALKIAIDICHALEQAHKRNILHRDIKPANILLSEDREIVKLSDWGLAHVPNYQLTFGGQPGTILYMSVEQAREKDSKMDGRSDLYSVGATLFEMMTGHFYLDFYSIDREVRETFFREHGLSPDNDEIGYMLQDELNRKVLNAFRTAIIEREPERPTRYNPVISPSLEALILKALAKDPRDRFQTAGDMIKALEQERAKGPNPPPTSPPVEQLIEQARIDSKELKFTHALELLEQAKSIAPRYAKVYAEIAALYNLMGRHTEATQVLEGGLRINPHDPALLRDLGLTYNNIGQARKAIDVLERSLQFDPTQSKIRSLVMKLKQVAQ